MERRAYLKGVGGAGIIAAGGLGLTGLMSARASATADGDSAYVEAASDDGSIERVYIEPTGTVT